MKINGIEVVGNNFAYNGCHKIYIIETEEDLEEALNLEYEIRNIADLPETYKNSCELRFINNWKLDKTYVGQYEKAVFEE